MRLPLSSGARANARVAGLFVIITLFAACVSQPPSSTMTLSFVGINDIHGQLAATEEHGSLVDISAYINALRHARAADDGVVVVLDAGDMWQGTLASNLTEGASMVEAYNALGVAAAAIGNHEFDFGPVGPAAIPMQAGDDPRGALKQRAREAEFPLLAANLIDDATGQPVDWENVRPSAMLDAGGVIVGVIGVLTENGLKLTIAPNTTGLSLAPLVTSIEHEARLLRDAGADLVVVVAHAGGRCSDASDPEDISSCATSSELVRVAAELETGLVDHIFGGHLDYRMAHMINGTSVGMNISRADSFSRVDFQVDRETGQILDRQIFPPQVNVVPRPAIYEGYPLQAIPEVEEIATAALAAASDLQAQQLGVVLEEPFPIGADMNLGLHNLVTEALLESFDVDIAMHNVRGGLRRGLPAGELTYGAVYEMSPFDNIATIHTISGSDLRRVIASESTRFRRVAFAGMRVFVQCQAGDIGVRMLRDDSSEILDTDEIRLLTSDYLWLGGDNILTPIIPPGGFELDLRQPLIRDALVEWFRQRGGTMHPADWRSHAEPKWNLPAENFSGCAS